MDLEAASASQSPKHGVVELQAAERALNDANCRDPAHTHPGD